jgi:hypothetical protein
MVAAPFHFAQRVLAEMIARGEGACCSVVGGGDELVEVRR